jgi:Spx/MgsR family transcriptional regulator
MALVMFGIPNCDTVKKARGWLDAHGIGYAFHDYKKAGANAAQVARWVELAGLDTVLNRAGTTFRKLSDADKAGIDALKGVALMVAQPSLIKRPIFEYPGGLLVGFSEAAWAAALG